MQAEVLKQHRWLQRLIGEWTYESECPTEPGQPTGKFGGTEVVRPLGDLWILAEGQGEMPGGGAARMLMTIGYDPKKGRFVGTWVGSMMTHLWVYDGELDAAEKVLTLNAEGPVMTPQGEVTNKTTRYKDVIELRSGDHRLLTSHVLGEDGTWTQIMCAQYHRKK